MEQGVPCGCYELYFNVDGNKKNKIMSINFGVGEMIRNSYWALFYATIITIAGFIQYKPEFFIATIILGATSLICNSIEYASGKWKYGSIKQKRH